MKKVICFLMAFVVVCCSFAQAAVVSSGSQNNLIEMTISQQQDPSYRLLSARAAADARLPRWQRCCPSSKCDRSCWLPGSSYRTVHRSCGQ